MHTRAYLPLLLDGQEVLLDEDLGRRRHRARRGQADVEVQAQGRLPTDPRVHGRRRRKSRYPVNRSEPLLVVLAAEATDYWKLDEKRPGEDLVDE